MDILIAKLQNTEFECLQNEEITSRSELEGCTINAIAMIASHFLEVVADPDSLPLRMFDVCDWDNNGFHNFEEATRFATVTSGGPLDKESWLVICQEVNTDPETGLRFKDYAKLMDQDLDETDFDHALTARQHPDRNRTCHSTRVYNDMHVRSAPTASLCEHGEVVAKMLVSRKTVSIEEGNVVGAILAEVSNVTDLTGVVSPKKRRRSRRKKSKSSSINLEFTNRSVPTSELSAQTNTSVDPSSETSLTDGKPRRTTKGLRTTRLKTIICRNWELGKCQYGADCGFAHGNTEVKAPVQPACKHWNATGSCERGTACAFGHDTV